MVKKRIGRFGLKREKKGRVWMEREDGKWGNGEMGNWGIGVSNVVVDYWGRC